jgi:hypothetical protein
VNDDELLAYLKAADPAAPPHAPQPDPHRLVEAVMTTETKPQPVVIPARGRRPRLLVAAAAAAVIIGGGVTWAVTTGGGDAASPTNPSSVSLAFAAPGTIVGKCAAPTADSLRGYPLAFEGTVTAKQGDRVDLRVDHWFRGGTAETVRLDNDEQRSEAPALEIGQRYLVTAVDGTVPMCGGTSEATAESESLFRAAFEQ